MKFNDGTIPSMGILPKKEIYESSDLPREEKRWPYHYHETGHTTHNQPGMAFMLSNQLICL